MATMAEERKMRELAQLIERKVKRIYGQKMGFFLCVSPFNQVDTIADYISNTDRLDAIKWMRETADRLEKSEIIPAAKGPEQ